MNKDSNKLNIMMYLHCGLCLDELPAGISAQEYRELDIGWTQEGFQVWCTRHDCNVVHVDFEGQTHPADMTINEPPNLKLV